MLVIDLGQMKWIIYKEPTDDMLQFYKEMEEVETSKKCLNLVKL